MNTKKFIKKVNDLPEYRCIPDSTNDCQFIILDQGDVSFEINTSDKEVAIIDSEYTTYYFDFRSERDRELIRLLNKYSRSVFWDKPKREWFK